MYTGGMKIEIPIMFNGRIGVRDYWKGYAIGIAFNLIIGSINSVFVLIPESLSLLAILLFILILVPYIVLALASFGLYVRRLHDLNLSGWWALLPFALVALFFFPIISPIAIVIFFLAILGLFVVVPFVPGKKEENKYGQPVKYDSWLRAYFGNKDGETLEKLSPDAILIGSLVDVLGTSIASIPVVIYVLLKIDFAIESIPQLQNLLLTDPVAVTYGWIVGSAFSVLGGYVAARMAKQHLLVHAALTSVFCIFTAVSSLNGLIATVPTYTVLALFATPLLTLIGGYIRLRQTGQPLNS